MKRSKSVLVAAMALALVLMTFGVGLAQDPTVDVTLGMSEFKFEPAELNVTSGQEVTFNVSNTGQFPHNVTFVAPDGTETDLFADNLTAGQSATGTFTFNVVGDWKMYCPVGQHEEQGMVGTVRVSAAASDQAAAGASSGQSTTAGQAANPATLPTTGGENALLLVAVVGGLALAGGLWLRRARTA